MLRSVSSHPISFHLCFHRLEASQPRGSGLHSYTFQKTGKWLLPCTALFCLYVSSPPRKPFSRLCCLLDTENCQSQDLRRDYAFHLEEAGDLPGVTLIQPCCFLLHRKNCEDVQDPKRAFQQTGSKEHRADGVATGMPEQSSFP